MSFRMKKFNIFCSCKCANGNYLSDNNLSLDAKGLLGIISLEKYAFHSVHDIIQVVNDTQENVENALTELAVEGYIQLERIEQ